jgi:hypothetical protein
MTRLGAMSRVGFCPLCTYTKLHEAFACELGRKATEIEMRRRLRSDDCFAAASERASS